MHVLCKRTHHESAPEGATLSRRQKILLQRLRTTRQPLVWPGGRSLAFADTSKGCAEAGDLSPQPRGRIRAWAMKWSGCLVPTPHAAWPSSKQLERAHTHTHTHTQANFQWKAVVAFGYASGPCRTTNCDKQHLAHILPKYPDHAVPLPQMLDGTELAPWCPGGHIAMH